MRTAMVRIRSGLKNQIHALLADRGLHAEGSDIFAGELAHLTKLLPAVVRERADANLRLIEEIDKEVVAEVGEIDRFPTARRFCSWCGLTPTEHSSAENTRRGHISKQGSRWLRWVLVEVACHAYRNRELSQIQAGIASRRGDKIARVALARRIAILCYHALRSPYGCRAFPARTK